MMSDFSDMLSKAKKMREEMQKAQESIKKIQVEGVSGGNLVKIILGGDYEMKSIQIDPKAKNEKEEIVEDNQTLIRNL